MTQFLGMKTITSRINFLVVGSLVAGFAVNVLADTHMAPGRISDIVNTRHNFTPNFLPELPDGGTRTSGMTGTSDEVCVYCHTPHGDRGTTSAQKFLWNHKFSSATYQRYTSSSMDATDTGTAQPGEASKMCLSCHDGTVAIGDVNIAFAGDQVQTSGTNELTPTSNPVISANDAMIPNTGTGANRNLGTDLTNDHPIGITYDSTLAANDGEIVSPSESDGLIGVRYGSSVAGWNKALVEGGQTAGANDPTSPSTRKAVPLETDFTFTNGNFVSVVAGNGGKLECTSCHDPHIRSIDNTENIKFLRLHRFQKGTIGQDYAVGASTFDITTDINCLVCHKKAGWKDSVHATSTLAYDSAGTATADREFPDSVQVWEASCLNCHDAHTVGGARYLLREGTNATLSGNLKQDGGTSAIEESCFQCHGASSVLVDTTTRAKDIESITAAGGHDPFDFNTTPDPDVISHDVLDADLMETQSNIQTNRHVTCTDCHNPHRILKNAVYEPTDTNIPVGVDTTLTDQATHDHSGGSIHSNIASGALRGTTGVDITYPSDTVNDPFLTTLVHTVLSGDPDVALTDIVTKEYQICFKCHSDYGIAAANIGAGVGQFANTAAEFLPDDGGTAQTAPNSNSWHPVVGATGRTTRGGMIASSTFESPFNLGMGQQTMYCSDCHTNVSAANPASRTTASGPHGGAGMLIALGDALCDTCHTASQYSSTTVPATVAQSGFSCATPACITTGLADQIYATNLHVYHRVKGYSTACTDCHVGKPHGWRNKGLLVDISDVGGTTSAINQLPYYSNAQLNIVTWQDSAQWDKASCGQVGGCHDGIF